MLRFLTVILLPLTLLGCAPKQPTHFAQQLYLSHEVIRPGDTLEITLRTPMTPTAFGAVTLYRQSGIDNTFKPVPTAPQRTGTDLYIWRLMVPPHAGGVQRFQAKIIGDTRTSQQAFTPVAEVFVTVPDPKKTYLQQILFETSGPQQNAGLYLCVGDTQHAPVYGRYSDGVIRHLGAPGLGTRYVIADHLRHQYWQPRGRDVATVTEHGTITAIKPGRATLIVTNGSESNSRDLYVDSCTAR